MCETVCPYNVASAAEQFSVWGRPECLCESANRERLERLRAQEHVASEGKRRAATITRNRERSGIYGPLWNRTFDAFDPSRDENGQRPAWDILQLWAEQFEPGRTMRGWTLTSPGYGVGKSHLALAAGLRVLERGYSVRFMSISTWLDQQYSEFRAGGNAVGAAMRAAATCDLLIIDDLGTERIADGDKGDWTRQQIFRLFDERVNWARPVIVTTNLDSAGIAERLGADAMGGRIVSRLSQIAEVLRMWGPDSRPLVD